MFADILRLSVLVLCTAALMYICMAVGMESIHRKPVRLRTCLLVAAIIMTM